jgi:hypothetical protein
VSSKEISGWEIRYSEKRLLKVSTNGLQCLEMRKTRREKRRLRRNSEKRGSWVKSSSDRVTMSKAHMYYYNSPPCIYLFGENLFPPVL